MVCCIKQFQVCKAKSTSFITKLVLKLRLRLNESKNISAFNATKRVLMHAQPGICDRTLFSSDIRTREFGPGRVPHEWSGCISPRGQPPSGSMHTPAYTRGIDITSRPLTSWAMRRCRSLRCVRADISTVDLSCFPSPGRIIPSFGFQRWG